MRDGEPMMFNALFGIVKDTANVIDAAVEVPLGIVRVVTKPVGDIAQDIKNSLLEELDLDD